MTTARRPPGSVEAMSNKTNSRGHRPRSTILAALAVTAGSVLLTAACGGSASSSASSSPAADSNAAKDAAFQRCMASYGVKVTINGNAIGTVNNGSSSDAATQTALSNCRHLLPGGQASPGQQAQSTKQLLKWVDCMRTHGVPDMPDPNSNGTMSGHVSKGSNSDLNPQSPAYQRAAQACKSLQPPSSSQGSAS